MEQTPDQKDTLKDATSSIVKIFAILWALFAGIWVISWTWAKTSGATTDLYLFGQNTPTDTTDWIELAGAIGAIGLGILTAPFAIVLGAAWLVRYFTNRR